MVICTQLEDSEVIQRLRDDYLHTLVAPMDGMWESIVMSHAAFWRIQEQEQYAGHFCIDSNKCLLRFHLLENYHSRAQEIFRWVISTYNIQHAITSTIEPLYFSLCLSAHTRMMLHCYLFRDHKHIERPSALNNSTIRKAEKSELDNIIRFYRANTEGSGEWIEPFLLERLNREELFVLYDQRTLIATGECIPSQKQKPYADLGMVVARSYRGRGLGSSMLIHLKNYCYQAGWEPICSCAADNLASKKAIEKAGFISEQRMIEMQFKSLPAKGFEQM